VAQVVDQWLRGHPIAPEIRCLDENRAVKRVLDAPRRSGDTPAPWSPEIPRPDRNGYQADGHLGGAASPIGAERHIDERVFLFGVSRDKLEAAQTETGLAIDIATELRRATVVLTTKNHYRRSSQLVRAAESSGTPVYVLRKNTMPQVMDFLRTLAKEHGLDVKRPQQTPGESADEAKVTLEQAMQEAEEAAQRILGGEFSVQLRPQRAYVRRLQHMLAQRFSLASTSRGQEPERSVLIYRP
jgi:hypothetical protein